MIISDWLAPQDERAALCSGKSPEELRALLFDCKVTINDVRRELALAPISDGELFCGKSAPASGENAG